jgi:Fur family transcriptional regulator, ferric uptake regulator
MQKQYREILKKHQLNTTPCRIDILEIFSMSLHALSHSDIEEKIANTYDRVTLYRTLHSFEEKGLIHKITDPDGVLKFALCSSKCSSHIHFDGHVHFKCKKCNKTFCLDHVKIPSVAISGEYQIDKISFLAEGVCKDCG